MTCGEESWSGDANVYTLFTSKAASAVGFAARGSRDTSDALREACSVEMPPSEHAIANDPVPARYRGPTVRLTEREIVGPQ